MKRQRGRGRKPNNQGNRSFESNGPDVKIRGNAAHIYEKYLQLARDASSSGDRIMAENYYQHAEHYFRIVQATQPRRDERDSQDDGESGDQGEERHAGQNGRGDSRGERRDTRHDDRREDRRDARGTNGESRGGDADGANPGGEDEGGRQRRPRRGRRAENTDNADPASDPLRMVDPGSQMSEDAPSGGEEQPETGAKPARARRTRRPRDAEAEAALDASGDGEAAA